MTKMKINILFVLFFTTFIGVTAISAQEKNDTVVHKSVTVTREYQPVINDAGKIISTPKEVEPIVEKTKPVYSDITTPLNISNNIQSLVAKELLHYVAPAKKGFLRIGAGLPTNTLLDFNFPLYNDSKNRLDVDLHHLGVFTDKKHAKTSGNILYNHLFSSFDLYAGIGGSHDFFNYYGKNYASLDPVIMSDIAYNYKDAVYNTPEGKTLTLFDISGFPLNEKHWILNTYVGVRSLPLANNLRFDVNLNYNLFKAVNNNVRENQYIIKGLFEIPYENNRLGMDVDVYHFGYSGNPLFNFSNTYSLLKFNPYYKITADNGFLRLGVKTGISVGQGQVFTPSPDVAAQWNLLPDYLSVYGGISGDLTVNSMNRIYDENRYLSPQNRLADTYTPIDAYAGIKISPMYNFMFDVYAEHKIIRNQYFYVNRTYSINHPVETMPTNLSMLYHNRFDVIYAKAQRSSIGLRTSWDYKNLLNIYVKGAYYHWKVDGQKHAWQLPMWDADFGAKAKITNDLSINTQFIFQDGRYALLSDTNGLKMSPIADLNIGASYAYRDWLSVFVKLNNILNNRYEFFNGYETQRFNAMIGASFSF